MKSRKSRKRVKAGSTGRVGKAEAELLGQIEAAVGKGGLVQAVFMLRLPPGRAPAPKRVEKTAKQVLKRVARLVGTPATDFNVFGNLGAFALRAAPAFVHALLGEPEVVSAVANERPGQVLIRPHVERAKGKPSRPRGKHLKRKPAARRKARAKSKPAASRKKRPAR